MRRKRIKGFITGLAAAMLAIMMIAPATLHAASPTPGKVAVTKVSSSAYNKVTINWKKTSNATHYKIYYKKSGASKWTGLKTVGSSTTSYTHTASSSKPIVVGQKYAYTVRGYNSRSKKNGSYNTRGLTVATRPNTVKLGKASLNSTKTQATVTWSKASGANQYLVYRKTPGTGWKRLATVGSSTLKYTDKAPVKGQTNTYTIKSYYRKTKTAGKYNSKGISVAVPKQSTPKPDPSKVQRVLIITYPSVFESDGATGCVSAEVQPSTAINKKIIWEVEALEGASGSLTIDGNGRVTTHGKKKGDYAVARVYARSAEDPSIYDTADIKIHFKEIVSEFQADVLKLTNIERIKNGLHPLKYHEKVEKAAMIRAKELERLYEHVRPDGSRFGTVFNEVGCGDCAGENIAAGLNSTPTGVVWSLMNSPGHRKQILNPEAYYLGVGFYDASNGKRYWVQSFAGSEPDKTFTVTLNTMGGNSIAPITLYKDATLIMSTIQSPVRQGYTFAGWYTNSTDQSGLPLYSAVIRNNLTLYAKWIPA